MEPLETELDGKPVLVSRSGYTGEDGVEIILKSSLSAVMLWERLLETGRGYVVWVVETPCGSRQLCLFMVTSCM